MNDNILTQTPVTVKGVDTASFEPDFQSIDGPNTRWPTLVLSLLRIGRVFLAKTDVKREVTPAQITRKMIQHRNVIPCVYTPKEMHELLWQYHGELRGGGIKVEWQTSPSNTMRGMPIYDFTFTRLYTPEQMASHYPTLSLAAVNKGGVIQDEPV